MKYESRLAIVNNHIKRLERVVVAETDDSSALLTQLRKLREDIKTTAKKDYLETQKNVLNTFRTLMEQLATLSFYASEAEEDTRNIEKAISQLNKIKSSISEDLLGLAENKEEDEDKNTEGKEEPKEKVESSAKEVDSDVQNDIKNFVEQANGTYFENYEVWFNAVKEKDLKINIDGNTVEALNDNGECFGKYRVDEMEGCLFNSIEDYDRAFEEEGEEDVEEDEDAIEEDDE